MKFCPAALTLLLIASCGSAAAPAKQDSIDLGRRLATDSRDWRAHAALAQLRYDEGALGASLREYLIVERQEKLTEAGRKRLGELLVRRAQERLRFADPGAYSDLQHAAKLGTDASKDLQEALALKAASELRHSSDYAHKRASGLLLALREQWPADPRGKLGELSGLVLDDVVVVWRWLEVAGAKRQALRVAQHYVDQGGRDPRRLQDWIALHRWWFGGRRPALPSEAAAKTEAATPLVQAFAKSLADIALGQGPGSAADLATDWELESWSSELGAVAESHPQEPARAEILARDFVDGDVYGGPKLVALAELYYRLGDIARAKKLAIELATLAPDLPAARLAAGLACALEGDLGPADQYFTSAAAASGDPGRYWGIAGATLHRAGYPLAAIGAYRRALSLTAPGDDLQYFLAVYFAQKALGRAEQAEQTKAALVARFPAEVQAEVRSLIPIAVEIEATQSQLSPQFLGPLRADLKM